MALTFTLLLAPALQMLEQGTGREETQPVRSEETRHPRRKETTPVRREGEDHATGEAGDLGTREG